MNEYTETVKNATAKPVRVLVEDEEFGEDFYINTTIGAVIAGLRMASWATVYRVPNPDGTVKLPSGGLWLCLRVGDE